MFYLDYKWDLSEQGIVLDEEIDITKLGWQEGDYFVIKEINGQTMLVKVDPLVKFLKDGTDV
jgi:hypothetical protein